MADERTETNQPIVLARRLVAPEVFRGLFREGMTLVEETATYLDGDGRTESRSLPRSASLGYATESMRLTTRLMQLASWLLLQRAVNDGEMPPEQASLEKAKIKLGGLATATEGPSWDELPEQLRSLILRSLSLRERIRMIDRADASVEPPVSVENPVARQIDQIAQAFGGAAK